MNKNEIEIFVPFSLPFPKYEGKVVVTLIFPDHHKRSDIKIPISFAKKLNIFQQKNNELENDYDINITKTVQDADVEWENSLNIISNYFEPIPLIEIYSTKKDHIILKISPNDIVQTFLISKLLGITELVYFIELKINTLSLQDSIFIFKILENFLKEKQTIPELRAPIIENILKYIDPKSFQQIIDDYKLYKNPSFSQVLIRYEDNMKLLHKENKNASIKWLLLVYSTYKYNDDFCKAEILRLLFKLGDFFLLWCYSFVIDELILSEDEYNQIITSFRLIIETFPNEIRHLLTNIFISCINTKNNKQNKEKNKKFEDFINNYNLLEYVDISLINTKYFPIILSELSYFINHLQEGEKKQSLQSFFSCLLSTFKKRKNYIHDSYDYINVEKLTKDQLIEYFYNEESNNQVENGKVSFVDLVFEWLLYHYNEADLDFVLQFYNLIETNLNDNIRSPLYLLLALDCFNRLKTQHKPLLDNLNPTIIGIALKQAIKLPTFPFHQKTLIKLHNFTYNDHMAHDNFLLFLDKFNISIKKNEMVLPITESNIKTVLSLLEKNNPTFVLNLSLLEKLIPISLLLFDYLSYEDIILISKFINSIEIRNDQNPCFNIINNSILLSNDEQKICCFANLIKMESLVLFSHIPFNVFAANENFVVNFTFPNEIDKKYLLYDNIVIEKEKWCSFEPLRHNFINNTWKQLLPNSICLLVFSEAFKDGFISTQLINDFFSFSGINNVSIIDCLSSKPEDLDLTYQIFIFWEPNENKESETKHSFNYSEWLNKLKGKNIIVSATILKFDSFSFINENNNISLSFEDDSIQQIEWDKIDDSLISNKNDLFSYILKEQKDNLFMSISFTIHKKSQIVSEICWKNGREFAVVLNDFKNNCKLGIFNFNLPPPIDNNNIFSWAAAKISSDCIVNLICEVYS